MKLLNLIALSGILVAAAGCSITPEYGCRAPDGVTCISASEIYDRDSRGDLISPKVDREASGDEVKLPPAPTGFAGRAPVKHGDPIFREPRRLRVWIVDWEDTAQVYHPNSHLYLRVDNGEWVLPAMRERLLDESDGLVE